MDENLKDRDVLLVKEKDSDELKAVKGINAESKKLDTVSPKQENQPDFMKIDRGGNMLDNFLENFSRQFKNPTDFIFFKVPADNVEETAKNLQTALENPESPVNKAFLDMHKVEQQTKKEYAINPDRVDWDQFERLGINREGLEKTGNVEKLLNWQKTDLMHINVKVDDINIRTDARLSLRETPEDNLAVVVHALRKEPELHRPYFGVQFTEEDKQNLLNTGNLGHIVEAEYTKGEKTPVAISIDKQTNELVAVRADKIKIPENIKGVALNEQQKKDLSEGKSIYLENMMSKKNTPFSAYLQFNADKRGLEFRFDNEKQAQNQRQESKLDDVPKTFRKKELSDEQRGSLQEGKTVYIDGLTDKNGKGYSGYITLDKEDGKLGFMFPKDYKEAVAAGKAVPDDKHQTQVAVNSEGKTNEATKNAKEPLDKGQTQPKEQQAEKAEKKRGIKM